MNVSLRGAVLAPAIIVAVLAAFACDSQPPQVVSLTPPNGAANVDPGLDVLTVKFNEPMRAGGWSWVIEGPGTAPKIVGEPSYDPQLMVNTVAVELEPNHEYIVWLNNDTYQNFADAAGNPLPPVKWGFRTAGGQLAPDPNAPSVVSTSPPQGATVKPGPTVLQVTFDRPMKDGGWSWVMEKAGTFPKPSGEPGFDASRKVNSLSVVLEPNREYVVWINSARFRDFQDEAGIAAAPYRWTFKTGAGSAD